MRNKKKAITYKTSKLNTYDRLSAVVEFAGTAALAVSKPFQTLPPQNLPDCIQYPDGDSD